MIANRTTHPVRTVLGLLAAIVLTSLLASCAGDSGGDGTGARPSASMSSTPALAGSTWNLSSYADPTGAQVPAVADAPAPITFATDGTYSGSTGCNRFSGTFSQDGSALTLGDAGMTLVGCSGPVGEQDHAVATALNKVTAALTSGADLQLSAADGGVLLTYTPGATTLVGSSWQATGINNGTGGVVSTAETSAATAQFADDGTMSGTGGCNTFTAPYTIEGSAGIGIGPISSTEMACPEPVSATEQQYFAALAAATTYQLEGGTLTLRDAEGATQVSFHTTD